MNDETFDSCWHRIDRANVHRREAVEIWNEFIAGHPYDFSLDHEGDGVYVLRVWQEEATPPELAVVIGEWFYNLRCTLDYIVWAAAVYESGQWPPPNESALQYPIYDSQKAWDRNLYRLKGLAAHHRDMLLTMQPFNSDMDANYLGWINRLARTDRHRRLNTVTAYLAELNPVIAYPDGCTARLQFGSRVLVNGRADVARITVEPWSEGLDVKVNPRMGIDPEIEDWTASKFWGRIRFADRFAVMQAFVKGEIAVYEYDCMGATRNPDFMTDSFKAESDARRQPKAISRIGGSPVTWGGVEPSKRSTRESFEGQRFPKGPAVPGS